MHAGARLFFALVVAVTASCSSQPSAPAQSVCANQLVDLQSDIQNCGACGHICPKSNNASALCDQGVCGSGPCDPGYGGSDCQTCVSSPCNPVLPETGAVFQAFASGSSYGQQQLSAPNGHSNTAVMGEPTPPSAVRGFVTQSSAQHENISGLNAALH